MAFLCAIPVILSALVLAAHFFRNGQILLVLMSLAAAALLAVPRWWVARAIQVFLIIGALEWVRTAMAIADERLSAGQPWLRMAIILGCVAMFTLLSSLVIFTRPLRRHFYGPPATV